MDVICWTFGSETTKILSLSLSVLSQGSFICLKCLEKNTLFKETSALNLWQPSNRLVKTFLSRLHIPTCVPAWDRLGFTQDPWTPSSEMQCSVADEGSTAGNGDIWTKLKPEKSQPLAGVFYFPSFLSKLVSWIMKLHKESFIVSVQL